jgi:imidazolonepropionase
MSKAGDTPGVSSGSAHDQRGLVVRNVGRLTTWHGPVVEHAAVVITDGRVAWTGADSDLPAGLADAPELDADGAAVLPGFVDSHTHAVWAGSRRDDFIGRVSGASYTPHGIHSTVAATRAASYDELLALTTERLIEMRRHGTTTVEIKSGYGLTPGDEVQLLAVARQAADKTGLAATTTYLGAHAVPPERDRADYVDEVVATIPAAVDAGAQWCDVFCDEGAFTVDETRRILTAGRDAGLGLRMHAEQIAHTGAAGLAADLGCASADHLDHVTPEDAQALAAAGVVATLVPVASLYSRSMRWDHARTLRDGGCTLAIATDCNPGTAWCESMPYAMQLACLAMGLDVETTLRAATLGGAQALRRTDVGHLGVGAKGDLVVVTSDHESDLLGHLGTQGVMRTVVDGQPIG